MRTTLVLSSLLVIAVACKRDTHRIEPTTSRDRTTQPTTPSTPSTPSTTTSSSSTTPGAADSTPSQAPAAAMLDCNTILAADVRDHYLPNMTITEASTPSQTAAACQIQDQQNKTAGMLQANCDNASSMVNDVATIKRQNPNATDVKVGKSAVLIQNTDNQELSAWDADSNCRINLRLPKSVDAVAVGQAVLDQLPPRG